MEYKGFTYTPTPKTAWDNLSMLEKSEMMKVAVRNGITDLKTIREKYNEFAGGGDTNPYTVGATVDALYASNPREEFLGEPSHHYDFTQSEEWANEHGYYPDARGHRDDRVKKLTHPSHPSRGTWNGDKFGLTDLGMQNPNYTLFGLNDGGQDPQAVLTYQGGIVLPEVTVTPNENYFYNPYDNIILHQKANGGKIHIKPSKKGTFTAAAKKHGMGVQEFASKVLANKDDYSPAMVKKANFARNSSHWKHGLGGNLFEEAGQMQIGRPFYSYDWNGNRVTDASGNPILNYNITLPEVTIIPDSRLSPAERNYREKQRQKTFADYAEQNSKDYTTRQSITAQRQWENSPQKKALDLGIAAAQGIGMASDVVSPFFGGIPVYSGLKGAQALDRATSTNELADYADAALWLSPILTVAGKKLYDVTKPAVQRVFHKGTPAAEWSIGRTAPQITAENATSITPEQWDTAYKAAYEAGDRAEGQRLWDLWFKQKAPNTKQTTPMFNASGESTFNEFNGGKTGLNWFSESEEYAANHGVPRAFYINEPDIYFGNVPAWVKGAPANEKYINSLKRLGYTDEQIAQKVQEINEAASNTAPAAKSVGLGVNNELVTKNNNSMKLAEPFTIADNGNLIPLTKRADFSNPDIRYDLPSSDIIIESSISANPNIPFDEAWLAASKGKHQMSNLVGSDDYAGRVRQAYQDNGIPVNQADFEILQAKQGIKDSNLKVIPNLKSENGEVLNGQYDPNTRQVLVSQDRDNILDVVETSGHEHAHASEVEKLLELLKEKWKHIKPRKEAFTRSDGSIDTEWKDYISKIVEMRAPAMSVWSEMKELGFNKVGDYLHHLKRFGLEDKQWEALVNRYGITNAKYMVETVFGLSPFVINRINNEEKDSTTM